jgi:hypothetical protein
MFVQNNKVQNINWNIFVSHEFYVYLLNNHLVVILILNEFINIKIKNFYAIDDFTVFTVIYCFLFFFT